MNDENLKPFQKGDDPRRNLKGRPKLPDLREVMAEILGEEKDGKTALQTIVSKLQELAAKGNIKAAEVLLARGYGIPKQQIEHSGEIAVKQITGMEVISSSPIPTDPTDTENTSVA